MVQNNKENLLEGFLFEDKIKVDYKQPLKQDFLEKKSFGFSDVANLYASDDSMENILKSLTGGKILDAKELVEDINEQIRTRKDLQKEVFSDIDKLLLNMNNFLSQKGDKIDAVEQLKLRERLIGIEEFKMQEKINAFRDVAALKKELRERIQEIKEKESNQNVIEELLSD